MASITIPVGRGTATGIDPSLTDKLQGSVGVVYEPGDPAAHKMGGRVALNETPLGTSIINDVIPIDTGSEMTLLASTDTNVYNASLSGSALVNIHTLPTGTTPIDATSVNNTGYVVSGRAAAASSPFGAFSYDGSGFTTVRLGMSPAVTQPSAQLVAGPGITGTYEYWMTEYNSLTGTESAYPASLGAVSIVTTDDRVLLTRPSQVNSSATQWRTYRTIAGGAYPIGWLVSSSLFVGTTLTDDTSDADLVLNDPYRIVTINGVAESMDSDPQPLALSSITAFQGSLVGTTTSGGDIAFTPALEPHSWPDSYRITLPSLYGGNSKCVRRCGDGLYVAMENETFRINYLPDESDAVFSPDIAVEHVANYGTPSAHGMCSFTAWGGSPVLFIASAQGPILISGQTVDRAVANIDWDGVVERSLLSSSKVIDNPNKWRVEFYFRDSTTDSTSWKALHFYYDQGRIVRESGPLPEMAWTGPHPVPGPGCYAVDDGVPTSYTARRDAVGLIYVENNGTSDDANLTDASGTIPFRLRTSRIYPKGIDSEATLHRVFISKADDGVEQDYAIIVNAHRENGISTAYPDTIVGSHDGVSSIGMNASLVSVDVEVNADGTSGMAPINNITLRFRDEKQTALKTVTA